MKTKILGLSLLAAMLVTTADVFAQGRGRKLGHYKNGKKDAVIVAPRPVIVAPPPPPRTVVISRPDLPPPPPPPSRSPVKRRF